ncbi:MAG: nucleotidyltransferase family protein [Eubacteriaceae bacterium]|nr:nucleotidyltransferase family protein [Eubacteriaceae bacterium]
MDIQVVILAAGYSSRANTNKLLLELNSKTVIENCINSFYDICSNIIVVGGFRIDELKPVLKHYNKVNLVFNPFYDSGMFSSVKQGLMHANAEKIFITPGDFPLIKQETLYKMLLIKADIVIPSYNGKYGHPVLLSDRYTCEIMSGKYLNLRDFIQNNPNTVIDTDDIGVLYDIDTMDDYEYVKNKVLLK